MSLLHEQGIICSIKSEAGSKTIRTDCWYERRSRWYQLLVFTGLVQLFESVTGCRYMHV
jgi:hypothetical protein